MCVRAKWTYNNFLIVSLLLFYRQFDFFMIALHNKNNPRYEFCALTLKKLRIL